MTVNPKYIGMLVKSRFEFNNLAKNFDVTLQTLHQSPHVTWYKCPKNIKINYLSNLFEIFLPYLGSSATMIYKHHSYQYGLIKLKCAFKLLDNNQLDISSTISSQDTPLKMHTSYQVSQPNIITSEITCSLIDTPNRSIPNHFYSSNIF